MSTYRRSCGVVAFAILGACLVLAQDKADKPAKAENKSDRPLCPVMSEPIDFTVKTQSPDGPVYFCCDMCITKYKKEPAKFAEQVKEQRAALAKRDRIQGVCPVSGKPAKKDAVLKTDAGEVHFCCEMCPAEYKKGPAKYKAKLEDSYIYQTKCPTCDQRIDPAAYVDLSTGQRIYFCCKDCAATFQKSPEKYADKLEQQGVTIDVDKLKSGGEKKGEKKEDTKP